MSGSFIVSGACHAEVEHVGIDNYATKIANEARNRKPVISELVTFFNKVTKFTSFLVLPLSILMLYQALIVRDESMTMAIVNTSTALLGMLPKGLVLLTSVSMAASIVRLGKKLLCAAFAVLVLAGCSGGAKTETKTCSMEQSGMKMDNF